MFAAEYRPVELSRRRAQRAPVSLYGEWNNAGLEKTLCKVVDLSAHGCRLQTYSELARGRDILLTLPGMPTITTRVVWAEGFTAGCLFQRPLKRTQFEWIVERFGVA